MKNTINLKPTIHLETYHTLHDVKEYHLGIDNTVIEITHLENGRVTEKRYTSEEFLAKKIRPELTEDIVTWLIM